MKSGPLNPRIDSALCAPDGGAWDVRNATGEEGEMIPRSDIVSRIWQDDRRLFRFVPLLFASSVYRAGITLRNHAYDAGMRHASRMPCPVISVGNIMVGGTGKTPMVIMLARMLQEHGWKPAVLSRGYGGKRKGPAAVVSDGHEILTGPEEGGDEPVLMGRSLPGVPVIVAGDRSRAGRVAVDRFQADVLILDDGFQHRRLARDMDIVLLDAGRPFGNGFLLPRGGLREPPAALRRADVVVMTSTEEEGAPPPDGIPPIPVFSARRRPVALVQGPTNEISPLADLAGQKVCAFTGIARPDSFRRILEPLCGGIVSFLPFPDHHTYTARDVEDIRQARRDSGARILLTTEKDGIKLTRFSDFFKDVCLLRIDMEIMPSRREFEEHILTRLRQ